MSTFPQLGAHEHLGYEARYERYGSPDPCADSSSAWPACLRCHRVEKQGGLHANACASLPIMASHSMHAWPQPAACRPAVQAAASRGASRGACPQLHAMMAIAPPQLLPPPLLRAHPRRHAPATPLRRRMLLATPEGCPQGVRLDITVLTWLPRLTVTCQLHHTAATYARQPSRRTGQPSARSTSAAAVTTPPSSRTARTRTTRSAAQHAPPPGSGLAR